MDTHALLQLTPTVRQARLLAVSVHGAQRYGDGPYADHLDEVVGVLLAYGYTDDYTLSVGFLHDALEDTKLTQADVDLHIRATEVGVALRFVTDEPGHNRKTRKANTYAKVAAMREAADNPRPLPSVTADPGYQPGVFIGLTVKLADRIANLRTAKATNPGLLKMYRKEAATFSRVYGGAGTPAMWVEMKELLA